jgi:hypothetical protein
MEEKNSIRGKKARGAGARFELKVRGDLEAQGCVLDKWSNNVDIEEEKIIKAKRKYNPFMRALSVGTGFPDFICIKRKGKMYDITGVEVKSRGYLKPEEKEKCKILLKLKTFNKILIAKKGKKPGEIIYEDFEKKYNKT